LTPAAATTTCQAPLESFMSFLDSARKQLAPIHPEGLPFIGGFALVALILFWLWTPLGWLAVVATAWCAYFFRDPRRVTPVRDALIVAPADGRISQVALAAPPAELEMGVAPRARVSIFMSVFDVHVNRSPASGQIERVAYRPGKFINADLDKASEENERNGIVLRTPAGRVGVVQIAGLIARRIVCFVREGQTVNAGDRIGLIRFGSRVDVYLPEGARPQVSEGQLSIAGETVLADLSNAPGAEAFRAS
jgi:phosphatidylserine decarboxylase